MSIPNSDDLVMIRRGDFEALKQEAIFGVFRRDAVEFDKLNALLSNSPVVSAEPIGRMTINGVIWFKKNPHAFPLGTEYYTTPQQPQSVADALEEAAKICDDYANSNFGSLVDSGQNGAYVCSKAIRALIKRNAVKQVEVTA